MTLMLKFSATRAHFSVLISFDHTISSIFVGSQQRVMDSAEQAALSETDRDSAHYHQHHQAQSQTGHRPYDSKHISDFMSDEAKEFAAKPMRRFEKLVVNLTHSSVYAPDEISLSGTASFSLNFNCVFFS